MANMKRTNKLEDEISAIVQRRCSGVQISIMDIGKVFNAGILARKDGRDVEEAVVAEYARCSASLGAR
jgi:hypothetical protein